MERFNIFEASAQKKGPESAEINQAYETELAAYRKEPPPPCTKAESLRLLKKFRRTDFHDFWVSSVDQYLPAVREGTMRLFPRYLSHDEAFSYAKKLAAGLSQEQLARDFLYGLAHNEAAYRTALPVWFYIKNLPEHAFSPFTTLTPSGKVKVYYDKACSFCNYQHKSDDVPKMEFLKINTVLCQFYFDGGRIWGLRDLGRAIIFLEEYLRLPRPSCRQEDYTFFQKLIEEIESAPPETTARGLQILWKKAGLLSMTKKQTDLFIDALGYLNILHTADTVGIREKFVADLDMPYPLSSRTYFDYPVNCWKRSDGIDYQSIKTLFENLY